MPSGLSMVISSAIKKCSMLRLSVQPGSKTQFCPESPTLFHTNGGIGRVGKLKVQYHQDMVLGEIYPEIGFITQAALEKGGVEIEKHRDGPICVDLRFSAERTFQDSRTWLRLERASNANCVS